jgi:hypothetical protein
VEGGVGGTWRLLPSIDSHQPPTVDMSWQEGVHTDKYGYLCGWEWLVGLVSEHDGREY